MPRKRKLSDSAIRLAVVTDALDDKKAVDVEVIPLEGRTLVADYFVLATGTSSIHIRTLAEAVEESFESKTGTHVRREGQHTGNWLLLDCGDVVVHIFTQEAREHYNIEKLWKALEEGREAPQPAEPATEETT